MSTPKELIGYWVEAFHQANAGALAEFNADDAVSQVTLEPVTGKENIKKMSV